MPNQYKHIKLVLDCIKPNQKKMLDEFLASRKIKGRGIKGNITMVSTKVNLPVRTVKYYLKYRTEYIRTVAEVKKWFGELTHKYRLAFHPDDNFRDYISITSKKKLFTAKEANLLNRMMREALIVCQLNGKDIYEVAFKIQHPKGVRK